MGFKEIYEKMSNEELLERYKNFQDYCDDAKEAMIEELRKRKLMGEEEIKGKMDTIKKYKEKKEEFSVKKAKRNSNYSFDINNNIYLRVIRDLHTILLMGASALMVYSFLSFGYGIATLSWKEVEGRISNLRTEERMVERKGEKEKITNYFFDYKYEVEGHRYSNNKVSYGKFEEGYLGNKIGKNHSGGDKIAVYYNPKNQKESVVFKYSLSMELLEFLGSIIMLSMFCVVVLKYEEDCGEIISRKTIIVEFLIMSLFFLIYIMNSSLGTALWGMLVIGCIIHIVITSVKMYIIDYLK